MNCRECEHYHAVMSSEEFYHFHDWCEVWESIIPDGEIDNKGYNDLENGKAWC